MTTNDTHTTEQASAPASEQVLAFNVDQGTLLAALAFVAKAVPNRPGVPVLTGVLLSSDGGTVTVAGFDLEQARWYDLAGAECLTPGRVLVSGQKLLDMVKKLRKGARVAMAAGSGVNALLTDGRTRYTLRTLPVDDYPELPVMPPVVGMVDAAAVLGAAVPVAKSAGKDATLPMMTGVRVFSEGARLSMEATDRYRLAVRDLEWAHEVDKFSALVPARTLVDMLSPLAKLADVVTIGHERLTTNIDYIGFEAGPARAMTRLLDGGNYPPVRSLLPANITAEVDVAANDLIETIGRVAVACERATPVVLDFTTSGLVVSAGTDYEGEASERVAATWSAQVKNQAGAIREAVEAAKKSFKGKSAEVRDKEVAKAEKLVAAQFAEAAAGMRVCANPTYLVDALKGPDAKRLRLRLVSGMTPFVIVPLDGDGGAVPGVSHLVMPIRTGGGRAVVATDAATVEAVTPAIAPQPAAKPKVPASVPVADPVAPAGLDKTVPHPFERAVEDGKKSNPFTKCRCGTTRNAKVHRDQAPAAPAVEVAEPVVEPVVEPVAQPLRWLAVLGLTAPVDGRMTTYASEKLAREAIAEFGHAVSVEMVADERGKRLYVECEAQRGAKGAYAMHEVACRYGVPVHLEQQTERAQGAPAGDEQEETPVVASENAEPFSVDEASKEAYIKFGTGDYEGAMALIRQCMAVAPDHQLRDRMGVTYGLQRVHDAIEVKLMEAEIAADAAADAEADAAADAAAEDDTDVDVVDEPAAVPVVARPADVDMDEVERALRVALAGHPEVVIQAAIAGARARVGEAASSARPVVKPAARPVVKPAARPVVKAAPVAKARPVVESEPAGDGSVWGSLGMAEPVSAAGERVFFLPVGTRVRAARKAVLDALIGAHTDGELAERASVEADKTERPVKLVVRFGTPGVLSGHVDVVDAVVAEALTEFLAVAV